jgi:hypothetical protein
MIYLSIIILLCIVTIILSCLSIYKQEQFEEFDLSCEAIQNKNYHIQELIYKASCPNLVIVEKYSFGKPVFTVEVGDQNGPHFSKDYGRYYHLGVSPDGKEIDLEYDLYHHPWYNPIRWFNGPYGYYRRNNWGNRRNRRNRKKMWNSDDRYYSYKDRIHNKDRQDRQDRQDRHINKISSGINKNNINKAVKGKGQGRSAVLGKRK